MRSFRHKMIYTSILFFVSLGLTCFAQQTEEQLAEKQAIVQANLLSKAFRDAANKVIPATVKVQTVMGQTGSSRRMFPFDGPGRSPNEGLGTGIIIDPKGVILTNNHVISGADDITILLSDGREYKVTERKTDQNSDLAVLTIEPEEELPSVQFADSDAIDVGDWVVAVGNPFNFESTVSVGIISARWRTVGDIRRGDFLQTDAAINPGNSGGPLINLNGEVVGINTAIVSQTGNNSGVGFAIASNTAKWVAAQLEEKGKVERAYLGIAIEMVDAKLAASVGAKPREGVYVGSVNNNTPAKEAGLKVKDIILAFNGRPVNSPTQLQSTVERSDLEAEHEVTVFRNKEILKLPIKVAILPRDFSETGGNLLGGQPVFYRDKSLGLSVISLTPDSAEKYNYQGLEGVIVVDVTPGSLAANAGIKPSMLITHVDDKPVKDTDSYAEVRKESSLADGIKLNVESEDGQQEIVIKRSAR